MLKQKGQTLIEITIAAGLTIAVIAAIAITSITSLKNNDFARNQLQATRLSQEGLEKVRSIKNRNLIVCLTDPTLKQFRWESLYSEPTFTSKKEFTLQNPGCVLKQSLTPDLSPSPNSQFTRHLYLEKMNSNEIKLTSEVLWNDSSGTHRSELVTILTKQ